MPKKRQARPSASGQKATVPVVSAASRSTTLQAAMTLWLQCVHDWYPDLLNRTHFLPPLQFNRVPYDVVTVAGQSVLVPQPPPSQPQKGSAVCYPASPSQLQQQGLPVLPGRMWPPQSLPPTPISQVLESDVKGDAASAKFLDCLRELAERQKEVMMVISQLEFRKYLDDETDPINAAACVFLPKPSTMARQYQRGDFDVLIIHRYYGLIVVEVKSVGADLQYIFDVDKTVVGRVQKALEQLNKADVVLCHMMSDMPDPVKVIKTLVLPNVTSVQLQHALSSNTAVLQALCQCMGTQQLSVAVSRCLCTDQMSQMSEWWQHAVMDSGVDPNMTDHSYQQLLARFCGPATTVDIPTVTAPRKVVRSQGDAVAETGFIVSSLSLYPQQVDLLNTNLNSAFIWGPPGTGKTVILLLKALQLLKRGEDVHLTSICEEGHAVTILAEKQLDFSFGAAPAAGIVHRHHYDFRKDGEMTVAVNELARLSGGKCIFVFIDEVALDVSTKYTEFCQRLEAAMPATASCCLWAASAWRPTHLPAGMYQKQLRAPLRCPPTITRLMRYSLLLQFYKIIPDYSSTTVPAGTDGPKVQVFSHRRRLLWIGLPWPVPPQSGHTGDRPQDCEQCGKNITTFLKDELHVGQGDLQWRDVLVLCGDPTSRSPLVRTLTGSNVPVRVVERHPSWPALQDLALAHSNAVTVATYHSVAGLERRVVVEMGGEGGLEGAAFWFDILLVLFVAVLLGKLTMMVVATAVMLLGLNPGLWLDTLQGLLLQSLVLLGLVLAGIMSLRLALLWLVSLPTGFRGMERDLPLLQEMRVRMLKKMLKKHPPKRLLSVSRCTAQLLLVDYDITMQEYLKRQFEW